MRDAVDKYTGNDIRKMVEGHRVILAGGFVTEDGQVKSGNKTKAIERSKT